MDDEQDNFFIENPPQKPIEEWIGAFAEKSCVEHVQVVIRGAPVRSWSNPNVCPE